MPPSLLEVQDPFVIIMYTSNLRLFSQSTCYELCTRVFAALLDESPSKIQEILGNMAAKQSVTFNGAIISDEASGARDSGDHL